ncbi:hypothetical protein WR25_23444 [Diploscapter pachys]|uniref:Tafazzin n=1 Tax=Diploscapter pachys TaxID=2018661 RepID=A0A2A2KQC2_9BILA|nr:hypothetical protein WR25_23444 [Diploscapter pachys]
MAESSSERVKKKRVVRPVVYGNTATPFGFKRESDGHTHNWTVFFRPFLAEDASRWIRKVQFKLHDSYQNPLRVIEKPPYEVSETGWGEFEIQIRVFFVDPNEKPLTAFHYLRLFQPSFQLPNGKTQVITEFYDEIIFQEPTVTMFKTLTAGEGKKPDVKKFHNDLLQVNKRTAEIATLATEEIKAEIEDLRESLKEAYQLIKKYKNDDDMDNDYQSHESTPTMTGTQADRSNDVEGFRFRWPFPERRTTLYNIKSYFTIAFVSSLAKIMFVPGTNKLVPHNKKQFMDLWEDRSRPLITMSNHRCNIDDPLMWAMITYRELLKNIDRHRYTLTAHNICFTKQLHTTMFSLGRCVPCVRGEGVYQKGMDFSIQMLNQNGWVHIFPEGRVNEGPMRFKWGIGRLVMESKLPPIVLPIWTVNMNLIWPTHPPYYPRFGQVELFYLYLIFSAIELDFSFYLFDVYVLLLTVL